VKSNTREAGQLILLTFAYAQIAAVLQQPPGLGSAHPDAIVRTHPPSVRLSQPAVIFDGGRPELSEAAAQAPAADAESESAEYAQCMLARRDRPHRPYRRPERSRPERIGSIEGAEAPFRCPRPAIRDIFVRDMGMIAFTPAPGGKVPGFPCDADRIQNAKFTK
jgi:hypothetical protein